MTLTEFLALLVPQGVLVAGKLAPRTNLDGQHYNAFLHTTAKQHTDFANTLVRMDAEHLNTYFALASYKQGFHTSPAGKQQLRVRTNVVSLKALWFDIDFKTKKDGTPPQYADAQAAAAALKAFSQATKIPTPSVLTDSGYGIHCYWPFDQPIELERWQRLADALKAAALEHKLDIDPVCTADACRVLRPIGTSNWKDPLHPKPVRLLHTSGKLNTADALEAALLPWMGKARTYNSAPHAVDVSGYTELTAGIVPRDSDPVRFDTITKHCAVARTLAETHGKAAPEPLWTASLQLLKHCEDGPLWVHPISDGHPGYNPDQTDRKWEQRLQNQSGPTLCSTFESYEPTICNKCPHRGYIKSPAQLGRTDQQPVEGLPLGWRVSPDPKGGTERLLVDMATNTKEWAKVLRHTVENLRVTNHISSQSCDYTFDTKIGASLAWSISFPGSALGNPRKLCETLAGFKMPLKEQEAKAFIELMTTWLSKLQSARRVADVTEQLGWVMETTPDGEHIAGFSYGPTTFYSDGRVRDDVRASREFTAIAKHFEPKGSLDKWKRVADFLATQNKPAFTAILAAGFGAPLLRFTGHSGGILSIVSIASGVGKSSALKSSQAIWGSPMHGMNAVDDTPKSVARKLGFLNSLPAYWDELRGRKTVDDFSTLAFQVTQGKERTRLDSSAQLRDIATWETMLVVASNESIFEAMWRQNGASNAGIVRTFEIVTEPFESGHNSADIAMLFDTLNANYGRAGYIYAQYLATNATAIEKRIQSTFTKLAALGGMKPEERFWFAIVTALIVGAQLADQLNLVKIDIRGLLNFLLDTINRMRKRTLDTMATSQPIEVLASFMSAFQDRVLMVDKFPAAKVNIRFYNPLVVSIPRAGKIAIHVSRDENLLRITRADLERWIQQQGKSCHDLFRQFVNDLGARELKVSMGTGTSWTLPHQRVFEFMLSKIGMKPDDIPVGETPVDQPVV